MTIWRFKIRFVLCHVDKVDCLEGRLLVGFQIGILEGTIGFSIEWI